MDCMLNLESYNIDLNDIHFMFAGLELTKTGVIPSRAIVSAQLLKEAIIEKNAHHQWRIRYCFPKCNIIIHP